MVYNTLTEIPFITIFFTFVNDTYLIKTRMTQANKKHKKPTQPDYDDDDIIDLGETGFTDSADNSNMIIVNQEESFQYNPQLHNLYKKKVSLKRTRGVKKISYKRKLNDKEMSKLLRQTRIEYARRMLLDKSILSSPLYRTGKIHKANPNRTKLVKFLNDTLKSDNNNLSSEEKNILSSIVKSQNSKNNF